MENTCQPAALPLPDVNVTEDGLDTLSRDVQDSGHLMQAQAPAPLKTLQRFVSLAMWNMGGHSHSPSI